MLDFGENINKHIEKVSDNRIKVLDSIEKDELISFLDVATTDSDLLIDLKNLSKDKLCVVFKYAMEHDDRSSPLITLNLFNLLKTYNDLEESFFNNEDIYFKEIIDMVDIKLELDNETQNFLKNFGIYFLSLIKSYNKLTYTPIEVVKPLPVLYQVLFSMMDFATAAGIFSRIPEVKTSECLQIENAHQFLNMMLIKTGMAINFLIDFYNEGKENGD